MHRIVRPSPSARRWLAPLLALLAAACNGGSSHGVTLKSIAVTPASAIVPAGTTQQLAVVATYSDGTTGAVTTDITWSTSDAAVASVDAAGLVTAQAAQAPDSVSAPRAASVTATVAGHSGSAQITVGDGVLQSITVTPGGYGAPLDITPGMLVKGGTLPLIAVGHYSDGLTASLDTGVAWSSSNGNVSVDGQGLAFGVQPGDAVVTAAVGTVSGAITVTVSAAVLQLIGVTPPAPHLAKGLGQQLTAVGVLSDGALVDLTQDAAWTSASDAYVSVTDSGYVVGQEPGTLDVTATFQGISGSASVTVTPAELTRIAISPASLTLRKGDCVTLSAVGLLTDGTSVPLAPLPPAGLLQPPPVAIEWTSSTLDATVDAFGEVCAAGAAGQAVISAALNGATGQVLVQLDKALLTGVRIAPNSGSVAKGSTQQFTAWAQFSDGTELDVTSDATWSSSDNTVADFDQGAGLLNGAAVGTVTLVAGYSIGGVSQTGSIFFTVDPPALTSIEVTPATATVAPNGSTQLQAFAHYADGSVVEVTAVALWQPWTGFGTWDVSAGLVTAGYAATSCSFRATFDGQYGEATVTVEAPLPPPETTPIPN